MINNQHHFQKRVSSCQPHTTIVQLLPTSSLAPTGQRTNGFHPARQTRMSPLDVEADISRSHAPPTADPPGEWSRHSTQRDSHSIWNIGNRPEIAPAHIRQPESNTPGDPHERQVVALVQFDSIRKPESRPNTTGPGTGTNSHASGRPEGQAPIDPDNSHKAFTAQQRPRGGVRQDKGVLTNASPASLQPAADTKSIRVQFANNAVVRSQNIAGARQKSGRITLWGLDPALKYELERVAAEEGLSLSHVGAIACEQWVHQRLHDRHEALLYPTMRQLVRDENRALGNRLVFFQMRTAFAAEQTRILTTNILSRFLKQQGVPDDTFNTLVDKSNKMSKRNIIARTPELKSLMEEWFASLPDDTENHDREEKK